MWNSRAQIHVLALLILLHSVVDLVSARGSTTSSWRTLSGSRPLVIAPGGFSGIFPDSSSAAYKLALATSVSDVILWCNVQLTKDGAGICFPNLKLENATNIANIVRNRAQVYLVNGVPTHGYFSMDYTLEDLSNVTLIQGVYSRTNKFDGNQFRILTVEDVAKLVKPPRLWLNIQHDGFYAQHNLSMKSFVISVSRRATLKYISSPEIGFLRSIMAGINPRTTKLIFRFMGENEIEPSTSLTYGSLLKNLTFIKSFASGILVPKGYIWPVDASLYLLPHTSVVLDAHKEGLEVFASDFSNDVPFSFNYSYDPLAEHLSFIDNDEFSVDGLLSDFPITPSQAMDCFAHLDKSATKQVKTLVISKCGASGDYPACTDVAYERAISDGVDVLDCPVQMSKDGVPFCSRSVNLIDSTTVAQSRFLSLLTTIPEIKSGGGIFTFSLTWNDIKSLTTTISIPYAKYRLFRNPKFKNKGTFLTLSDFLALTKNHTSLSGALVIIEHADYLAEKQGLSVTDVVLDALSKAGYDKPGTQKVMIQSPDSSVLRKFKKETSYEVLYKVDKTISGALDSAVKDIKKFADSVVVKKTSVFPENSAFLIGSTNIVPKLQSFNLSVYVETFSNEFVSQAWDYYSDATVEINSFVKGAYINGIITDFPKTAVRYRRNRCLNLGDKSPPYMSPVLPRSLVSLITGKEYLPPAAASSPVLTDSDVESPLQSVSDIVPASNSSTVAAASSPVSTDSDVEAFVSDVVPTSNSSSVWLSLLRKFKIYEVTP
ncbi:Glycerophosphodiester phosphodiesterase [Quillaja saponaria]|uniref:glycerophosphodiester phosphodiesterase n=1 Tax=Quillaja saponaria TaxID=32244 RepID=A0AAD7LP06_QUISA|nr:Glycerophosphodiester phosphodiesterase [Quillaja saponaria]